MKNKRVILKSFNGTINPENNVAGNENYWKLIGEKGVIIDSISPNDRVLVLFEKNLDDYKLENHNPIRNSLWIKKTDLEMQDE